jgi:SRSO17 transposase
MDQPLDRDGARRLEEYFAGIGDILNDSRRKASFALYAMGLLLDGDRKSVEPMAARLCPEPDEAERAQDRLLHLCADGKWSDRDVRRYSMRYGVGAMTARESIEHWILDDTGFIKQGKHSVGVQRQYTGSAGKTTNCQVAASLSVATRSEHLPIDFELYLPESWTENPARRIEVKIPDDIVFRTKPELGLVMIDRALADGVPKGIVLADSGYGDSSQFREALRVRGLDYAVGIKSLTKVWRIDSKLRRRGDPLSVRDLALQLDPKRYRRTTWRDGSRRPLWSRFAMLRVVPFHDYGWDPAIREDVWLLIEWPRDESEPTKFFFASLPLKTTRKRLVRVVKERYRTERVYEDLKGELGLDHYEGRSYPGWNHHVSCVLSCYAFVLGERVRRFSPSPRRLRAARSHRLAA